MGVREAVIVISKANRINVIVYLPKAPEALRGLEGRIAQVHADAVVKGIDSLGCSTEQKLRLLDSILLSAKQEHRETTSEG